jgi:hypothetical protein
MRPPFHLVDVSEIKFNHVTAHRPLNVSMFVLNNVSDFTTNGCGGVPDMHLDRADKQKF